MKYLTTYFRTPTFRKRYGHIGFIVAPHDSWYEAVSHPLGPNAEYFHTPKEPYQDDSVNSKSNEIFLFNLIKIESKIKIKET